MASVSVGTQTTTRDLRLLDSRSKSNPPAPVHTGRLTYANPQDLPSFPSLGLKKNDAAAGAAASLGWANARPLTLWTPEKDASAQTAATLANGYKMPAAWQPERYTAGSKTAAVLAAENAIKEPDQRVSMSASPWGSSAATQAFAAAGSGGGHSVEPRVPMTDLNRQKSLRAAKGAFAAGGRPRSTSSPLTYPDSANAAANALSAATIAHRPSTTIHLKMADVGAQPVTSMGSEMYTSNPPVKPEVDEKNHDEALHASAVAMAKRMYAHQQKAADAVKQRHAGGPESEAASGTDAPQQSMQFTNLQEAAYKLAQERLARLQDEHQRNRAMADYYGTIPSSPTTPARRITKLGKFRRRASSDGDVVASLGDDDRQRSRQIRNQMSLFSTRLVEVDQAKRTRDREALIAAAQKNVKATLDGMDEKILREQGRVMPAKLNEWEAKAHATAQARSDARMAGGLSGEKVNLGAGQYMDREKVEEIAARRVQPVLDEINEKAELERQRIAAQREEQEKKRLEWEAEKAKNAEAKENARRLKEEEKLRKEELKEEAKARKEEERRLTKEEKDRTKVSEGIANEDTTPDTSKLNTEEQPQHKHRLSRPFTPKIQTKTTWPTKIEKTDPSAISPESSPESANESHSTRVKNWLKSRLQRPRAKSTSVNSNSTKPERPAGGFIGGHALTRLHADGTGSMTSLSEGNRSASMHEVALAGRPVSTQLLLGKDEEGESSKRHGRVMSNVDDSVSSVSSEGAGPGRESRPRTKSNRPVSFENIGITPPRAIADPDKVTPRTSGSPSRDSKFIEIID